MNLQHHILTIVCEADASFCDPVAGAEALKQSLRAVPKFFIILDDLWEDPARPNMLHWLLPKEVADACSANGSFVVVATRHSSIVTTLLDLDTAHESGVPVSGPSSGVAWRAQTMSVAVMRGPWLKHIYCTALVMTAGILTVLFFS
jgi:hypothetical protein